MNAHSVMADPAGGPGAEFSGPFTRNGFLDGRFELLQPKKGLRAGSDAMFLAAAVPAVEGQSVIEAGVGTGAAALALLTRVPDLHLLGVECHPLHADLARRNAALNRLANRIAIIEGDFLGLPRGELSGAGLAPPFDHAMANPPYYDEARARGGTTASRAAAHIMPQGTISAWAAKLGKLVRPGGTVTFIHRPDAAPDLLAAMAKELGDIHILPLAPKAGAAAIRILVRGTRGSGAPLQLLSPFVLHGDDGSHTCQSEAVLRGGQALGFGQEEVNVRSE